MKVVTIVVFITLFVILCPTAYAADDNAADLESIYNEQYSAADVESLKESLPNDVAETVDEFITLDYDGSLGDGFTPQNIFKNIFGFFKSGGKRPLTAFGAILAIMLFGATVGNINDRNKTVGYVVTVSIASVAVVPIVVTVSACITALKTAAVFMLAFIPVFAALLLARGKTLVSAGFTSVMLVVCESIASLCSYVVAPLVGAQLGLSIGGSVLPEVNTSSVGRALKKISSWTLSLITTVLLGVLSIQTVVGSASDSLKFKTAKFLVGSTVPVVGAAVGEALSAVNGCVKLLGSGVAVYGIVAVCVLFLPVVLELLIWRIVLMLSSSVSDMLVMPKVSELLLAIDSTVSFVLGLMILFGVLFILSVTMVAVI